MEYWQIDHHKAKWYDRVMVYLAVLAVLAFVFLYFPK